jgi:DNA-directed RNA polymerase specialized sigma24 family protein
MDASDEAAIGRILHTRFLAGDIGAFNEIYVRYHSRLLKHVAFKANNHESLGWNKETADDAVSIAITDYFNRPEAFDPKMSSLLTYLRIAAFRDYQNEFSKEARHQRKRDVENDDDGWKELVDADPPLEVQAELNAANVKGEALMREVCKTEEDLIILRQVIDKERDASICITELGWPPGEESVRRLYREKDRLVKLIKRHGPKLLGDDLP